MSEKQVLINSVLSLPSTDLVEVWRKEGAEPAMLRRVAQLRDSQNPLRVISHWSKSVREKTLAFFEKAVG